MGPETATLGEALEKQSVGSAWPSSEAATSKRRTCTATGPRGSVKDPSHLRCDNNQCNILRVWSLLPQLRPQGWGLGLPRWPEQASNTSAREVNLHLPSKIPTAIRPRALKDRPLAAKRAAAQTTS